MSNEFKFKLNELRDKLKDHKVNVTCIEGIGYEEKEIYVNFDLFEENMKDKDVTFMDVQKTQVYVNNKKYSGKVFKYDFINEYEIFIKNEKLYHLSIILIEIDDIDDAFLFVTCIGFCKWMKGDK